MFFLNITVRRITVPHAKEYNTGQIKQCYITTIRVQRAASHKGDDTLTDINAYIENLLALLKEEFGDQLLYLGLQGSYLRGEATEDSDIDAMVILSKLSPEMLRRYRRVIKTAGYEELSCGFICGREEMKSWNRFEIPCLLKSTRDIYGKLADFVPEYTQDDLRNYIKVSIDGLYHAICHTYVHGDIAPVLKSLYKSAFFILQAVHFLDTGNFINSRNSLMDVLCGADRDILQTEQALKAGTYTNYDKAFYKIFSWCQNTILNV